MLKLVNGNSYYSADGSLYGPMIPAIGGLTLFTNGSGVWHEDGTPVIQGPVLVSEFVFEEPEAIGHTLEELDVHVGDVVEYVPSGGRHTVEEGQRLFSHLHSNSNSYAYGWDNIAKFSIVSRAAPEVEEPADTTTMTLEDLFNELMKQMDVDITIVIKGDE